METSDNTVILEELQQIKRQLSELTRVVMEPDRSITRTILPLADAAIALGYGSPDNAKGAYESAYRRIKSQHYRVGIEAIDRRMKGSNYACWYLDIEKCKERDRAIAARRSSK